MNSPTVFGPVDWFWYLHALGRLLQVTLAGAFGGVVNGLAALLEGGRGEYLYDPTKPPRMEWKATRNVGSRGYLCGQAVIGIGGAFAAVFGLLTLGNALQTGANSEVTFAGRPLYLVSLSVVGGFVGRRLLTGLGEKMLKQLAREAAEEQVAPIKQGMEKAIGDAKEARTESKDAVDNSVNTKVSLQVVEQQLTKLGQPAETTGQITPGVHPPAGEVVSVKGTKGAETEITVAASEAKQMADDVVLARNLVNELEDCNRAGKEADSDLRARANAMLNKLNRYRSSFPDVRTLIVVLANLHFELGYTEAAFRHLEGFLSARRESGVPENVDDETAWYNMGCYHAVLASRLSGTQAKLLSEKALSELENSFRIARKMGKENVRARASMAQNDPDLVSMTGSQPFQALVEEFTTPGGRTA